MRITESLVFARMRRDTSAAQLRYNDASIPLMTGQNVNKPSEDPSLATELGHLDRGIQRTQQWDRSIDRLDSYFGVVESHVQSVVDLLGTMETRALQMKNDSYDAEDRLHAAQEAADALHALGALANARQDGRYVFSGRAEATPPYDALGNFQGDAVGRLVPVGDDLSVEGDLTAPTVFGDPAGDASAFRALQTFQKALETNDKDLLETSLAELRKARDHATRAWSRIGSLRAELSQIKSFHEDQAAAYQMRASEIGTVDFAAAATQLRFAEDTYSASVTVSQRVADILSKTLDL